MTPDDGQKVCPKHVDLFTKIKLRISAFVGFDYTNSLNYLNYKNVENGPHIFLRVLPCLQKHINSKILCNAGAQLLLDFSLCAVY
jgi:hypothetical protein